MFLKALEQRGLPETIGDASAFARWLIDNAGGSTASSVNVTESSALTLPYVYACINVLSQTLAHVPLELMKMGNKGPKKARTHRLYNLLRFNPTPDQTGYTFRETLEGHRSGWGNGYAEIVRDGPYPVGFQIMYPDRTEPKRTARDGSVVYVSQKNDGLQNVLPAADTLHFSGLGYDGLKGYSAIHQAREAIGLGLAIHKFGGSFFGNGASPKGIIESEVPANSLASFAETFRENYGTLDKANGTPVLPKGLKYKPTQINPDDAQTLETLKYNRTEVCGMFRVPPSFVMDLEQATFTNAGEMDLHFVKHTMIPIFVNWENELNRKLLTAKERRSGYYWKFDVNGLLRGSTTDRYAAHHTALQDGWKSRNEVRQDEDMEQVEGLDQYLTPNNMVNSETQPSVDPDDDEDDSRQLAKRIEPLIKSIAERMASAERRLLERVDNDAKKVGEFYDTYPEFISRLATPTALTIEDQLNCTAEQFMANFAQRHIKKQLAQSIGSVGDLVISEDEIANTFIEALEL